MKTPREKLIPNSTQIPNVLLDLVMPRLPTADHERVLRYICRRTFGFGKKSDRIGLSQFAFGIKKKEGGQLDYGAGASYSTARRCLEDLCKAGIVQKVVLKNGASNGYRINYEIAPDLAVEACRKAWKARNAVRTSAKKQPRLFELNNPAPQSGRVLHSGAGGLLHMEQGTLSDSGAIQNKGNKVSKQSNADERSSALKSNRFNEFVEWYAQIATQIRQLKVPLIVTKAGKSNLGRFLRKHNPNWDLLEQLAIYFLAHPHYRDKFGAGLETFVSAGIMNALLNDMSNRPDFWKDLTSYTDRYLSRPAAAQHKGLTDMQSAMRNLVDRMAISARREG